MVNRFDWSITVLLLLVSGFIFFGQLHILPSCDIPSLLYDTHLFLQGGTYIRDFFETNPPLIFFIYSPAVFLAKITGVQEVSVFKFYTILMAGISCYIVSLLLKIMQREVNFQRFMLFVLMLLLLVLPFFDFGQREHFLLILIMPYLFSVMLKAEDKSIPLPLAVIIGVLAGLGFGLKPFFLPTLVLVELYLFITKRSFIRIESCFCALTLLLYLLYVELMHPNYIYVLLPLVMKFYFLGNHQSWITILTNPVCLYFIVILGYYLFGFPKRYQDAFSVTILLATIGMMLAFILAQSAWWYHILPALALSCLLVAFMVYQTCRTRMMFVILFLCYLFPSIFLVAHGVRVIGAQHSLEYHPLTAYLRQIESKKIYCFITTTLCNSLANASNHQFSGRFPIFWWVQGAQTLADKKAFTEVSLTQKEYLTTQVVNDLWDTKPDFVIVNTSKLNGVLNILDYFLQSTDFQKVWNGYHYVETFGAFTVYQRVG